MAYLDNTWLILDYIEGHAVRIFTDGIIHEREIGDAGPAPPCIPPNHVPFPADLTPTWAQSLGESPDSGQDSDKTTKYDTPTPSKNPTPDRAALLGEGIIQASADLLGSDFVFDNIIPNVAGEVVLEPEDLVTFGGAPNQAVLLPIQSDNEDSELNKELNQAVLAILPDNLEPETLPRVGDSPSQPTASKVLPSVGEVHTLTVNQEVIAERIIPSAEMKRKFQELSANLQQMEYSLQQFKKYQRMAYDGFVDLGINVGPMPDVPIVPFTVRVPSLPVSIPVRAPSSTISRAPDLNLPDPKVAIPLPPPAQNPPNLQNLTISPPAIPQPPPPPPIRTQAQAIPPAPVQAQAQAQASGVPDYKKVPLLRDNLGHFLCAYDCGKSFKQLSDMYYHCKTGVCLTGVQRERYLCPRGCGRSFATQVYLRDHIAQHDGVTYKCEICQKTFQQRSGLSKHKKTHLQQATK